MSHYTCVTLTRLECRLAYALAEERHGKDRQDGIPDMLQGDQSRRTEYELNGAGAEIAFSKWFGIFPNLGTVLERGAPDYSIHGVRLDVKSNDRPQGNLLLPWHLKRGRADIYIYLAGSVRRAHYELVGWTTEGIAFQDKYIQDLPRGKTRIVPRADLYPVFDLPRAIRQFANRRTPPPDPMARRSQ
jgi:hypothetical protein